MLVNGFEVSIRLFCTELLSTQIIVSLKTVKVTCSDVAD